MFFLKKKEKKNHSAFRSSISSNLKSIIWPSSQQPTFLYICICNGGSVGERVILHDFKPGLLPILIARRSPGRRPDRFFRPVSKSHMYAGYLLVHMNPARKCTIFGILDFEMCTSQFFLPTLENMEKYNYTEMKKNKRNAHSSARYPQETKKEIRFRGNKSAERASS
jgi:hypothetical protein